MRTLRSRFIIALGRYKAVWITWGHGVGNCVSANALLTPIIRYHAPLIAWIGCNLIENNFIIKC